MDDRVLIVVLVVAGTALMANPLYLPVAVDDPNPVYTHAVQPAGPDTPTFDGTDVRDRDDLDADARAAFDRAREDPEGAFVIDEPGERVDSLTYPTEPTLGDGLLIVAHEGEEYEFWTRTVEREPGIVVAQRLALQPVAFLAGFLAIVGAVAVAIRGRG
ncbi:hypothetical protein [Halorubrum vacuolatum]|uniref:DUF7979 domain-containing protein n=1 Tax=Halorubrum vacuolatum TaxID=63740 RepID=A0A238V7R2_HALVU|nr:hypothetical protein [Halorubrum vacuolatum]SNR30465.1 hypothetical protein SAMN06264855_10266 [Halorubrum vacuolatum]